MSCVYVDKNGEIYTEEQLINEFLISEGIQISGAIFSQEELVASTESIILKNIAEDAKDWNAKENDVNVYRPIKELIVEENPMIWNNFKQTEGKTRLSPKFDEFNWMSEEIKRKISESGFKSLSKKELDELRNKDFFNDDSSEFMSLFNSLLKDDPSITKENAAVIYNELLEDREVNRSVAKITGMFKTSVRNRLNDPTHESSSTSNSYKRAIADAVAKIQSLGHVISDVKIVNDSVESDNDLYRATIDVITIDAEGNPHIIKIVGGVEAFANWRSEKINEADYELAFQRAMLGKYLDISNTTLSILPVMISKTDTNKITVGDLELRSSDRLSGLVNNGSKTVIAELIFKRKLVPKYDPINMLEINNLLNKLIPDYKIRNEVLFEDVDEIIDIATKAKNRDNSKEYVWYDQYDKINIKEEDLDVFRVKIEEYVEKAISLKGSEVKAIEEAINHALKTKTRIHTSKTSSSRDIILSKILNSKLNDNYELIPSSPEARALGILLLRNKENNTIEVLNLTVNQLKAQHKFEKGELPESKADLKNMNTKSNMTKEINKDNMLVGDIENMKVMIFLNKFANEIFPNEVFKLGDIITFNTIEGKHHYEPSHVVLNKFKNFMGENNLSDQIKLNEDNVINIEDIALMKIYSSLDSYNSAGVHDDIISSIENLFVNKSYDDVVAADLIKIREILLEKYPEYGTKEMTADINFNDHIEVLFAYLQVAILSKSGFDLFGDFVDLTKWSIEFEDFKSLLDAIYTKDQQLYTKAGKKVQGLFSGLAWTNPEWVRSKDLRQVNNLISSGNTITGERLFKTSEKLWKLTDDYYNHIGFSRINQLTIGETQKIHEEFFILDSNNVVNREFKTKNPYSTTSENFLDSEEKRRYLQHMLLYINRYKYGIADEVAEKLDPTKLSDIESVEKFKEAIDSGEYFEVPLVRREELSRYKGLFQSAGDLFKRLSSFKDEITDLIDSRHLTQFDITSVDAKTMGYFEMYDAYGSQTRELKSRMIDKHGVNYFDLNLDTIAHRVAFAKIRKQTFDLILPTINSYMWWVKLVGSQQNTDIKNQLDYVMNSVKLAVFDQHILGDEEKTIATAFNFVKKISTIGMLAFRPALFIKEVSLGTMKNFMQSAFSLNEQFTLDDITKAYTKLLTIDKQASNEFNLIQKLNQFYRIANMDIGGISTKVQHDRHGIMRGINRWLFATSTAGDYYNRMSLMLAKMISEGSYDAHSMKDNKLVYDPTKDKRFEYYFQNRDKHKNEKGEFINAKGDVKFNEQRTRYNLLISEINKESEISGNKRLTEADLVDKAYSIKERNSIKAFSDNMYGSYDKDTQNHFNNTLAGIAMMQFLTFWPAKMRFWFGKPMDGAESEIGKYVQETVNKNGVEKPVYIEYIELPNGEFKRRKTTKVTDEKSIVWEGTYQEGVFYSLMYSIQDLVKGDFDSLKSNKLRRARAAFALGDSLGIMILLMIMSAIWKHIKGDERTISNELAYFMDTVNDKMLNEANVWRNTFGALNTDVTAQLYAQRIGENLTSIIKGDKTLKKALSQSIGALEFLKE